jgi:peptidyl-prolyl cis-trans isomerase SDCCAG10
MAVRNFVQLALEGAYDGTPFHRILPGVAIQGGGTADGGKSVFAGGAPFKDEFHSRLRFNRRGLVAAAGGGNANGAQFFVTLGPAPHLDRKHTIFGRLGGESIHAAAAIGEVEIGPDDAPMPPAPVIKSAEVVWNPFDDIAPRTTAAAAQAQAAARASRPAAATRDAKLLSFGEDDEGEDGLDGGLAAAGAGVGGRIVSAHDALGGAGDRRLAAPDESATTAVAEAAAAEEERAAVRARLAVRAAAVKAAKTGGGGAADAPAAAAAAAPAVPPAPPSLPPPASTTDDRRAAALAGPSSTARPAAPVLSKRGRQAAVKDAELLSTWQAKRAAYTAKRAAGGAAAEDAAVARLQAFQARLRAAKATAASAGGGEEAPSVSGGGGGGGVGPALGRADAYRAGDVALSALVGRRLTGGAGLGEDPLARDMDDDDDLETVDPLACGGGGGHGRSGGGRGGRRRWEASDRRDQRGRGAARE